MEDSTMGEADPFDDLQIVPIEPPQENQQQTSVVETQIEPPIPLKEESQKLTASQPTTDVHSEVFTDVDVTAAFTTDRVFETRAELYKWVRDVGKTVGTIIIINKYDKGYPGKKPRVYIGCERGGKYNQKGAVSRHAESKKCGCPFLLKGIKMPKDDEWMLNVACGFHNHPLRQDVEGHSYAKKLPSEEKEVLKEMVKGGAKPKEVLNALKERKVHNTAKLKTVYNARAIMKVNELSRRSQLQQLLKKVLEHEYVEWHRSEDTVSDLIWAHPESIRLAKCFPRVFLMDAYEQSKFCPPVVEIVGITSTNKTFSFAFVYVEGEKEDNYVWALECIKSVLNSGTLPSIFVTDKKVSLMNAIKRVFPEANNLLCRNHISRDLLSNCKKLFNGINANEPWNSFHYRWNDLILSASEDEYWERLSAFERDFSEYSHALSYVKETWLSNYKGCFVPAWTNQCLHFGNTSMDKTDNSQARLKRYLGPSQGNFNTVWSAIISLLLLQQTEIKASFNESLSTVTRDYSSVMFEELKGFVSLFALDLIAMEVKLADSVVSDDCVCRCIIPRTHGLPCSHEISRYKHDNRPIPISCIHPHWKKLSTVPTISPDHELNNQLEFQIFRKRYDGADENVKLKLLKKMKEIATIVEDATVVEDPTIVENETIVEDATIVEDTTVVVDATIMEDCKPSS